MSYLKFDKTQLVNLEYSLPKEILLSNESGVYCSTTIIGCNTRKYHGLLVSPVPDIDGGKHVLLSSLHETIIQHEKEFNLGINKYPGVYNPKGHKYARWFDYDPFPRIVYRVGGVVIQKEFLLMGKEPRLMLRYTLLEAKSPTKIRLKPFLAFRGIHKLSKTNMYADRKVTVVPNGVKSKLYSEYPELYLQVSKKADFVSAPDWYLDIEYKKEKLRGYEFHEDLFTPGYFETEIKKGQSVIFTAGLEQTAAAGLNRKFSSQVEKVTPATNFDESLVKAAKVFVVNSEKGLDLAPGYHWFGRWGRFPLISLPGLSTCMEEDFSVKVLDSMVSKIRDGLIPDHSPDLMHPVYGAADTSLWFLWALQQLSQIGGNGKELVKRYRTQLTEILSAYTDGKIPGVYVHENGLVHSFLPSRALTWMDSYIDGKPVTQRPGYNIEINALWYNALSFAVEYEGVLKAKEKAAQWKNIIDKLKKSMPAAFLDNRNKSLYDFVFNGIPDRDVRPNMLIAVSMYYTPFDDELIKDVLDIVKQELLVPKGIRSLSPRSSEFKPSYEGEHHVRDLAYHQGTVWPWLLGSFAEAWLRIHEKGGVSYIDKLLKNFEEDLTEHGIGMISEVYDGNPPHRACGAVSFAASVGELLRIKYLLSKYE